MPIIEAEQIVFRGARRLRQTCLELAAEHMVHAEDSYELLSTLPWNAQKDIWDLIMAKHRDIKACEQAVAKLAPLADLERERNIDKNNEFLRRHATEYTDTGTYIESRRYEEPQYWDRMWYYLERLNTAHGRRDRAVQQGTEKRARLVENSGNSILRFSLCIQGQFSLDDFRASNNGTNKKAEVPETSCTNSSHGKHYDLGELITPTLAQKRVLIVERTGDWYDEVVSYEYGGFEICLTTMTSTYTEHRVDDDPRPAETFVNALLSPIDPTIGYRENRREMHNSATRYLRLAIFDEMPPIVHDPRKPSPGYHQRLNPVRKRGARPPLPGNCSHHQHEDGLSMS